MSSRARGWKSAPQARRKVCTWNGKKERERESKTKTFGGWIKFLVDKDASIPPLRFPLSLHRLWGVLNITRYAVGYLLRDLPTFLSLSLPLSFFLSFPSPFFTSPLPHSVVLSLFRAEQFFLISSGTYPLSRVIWDLLYQEWRSFLFLPLFAAIILERLRTPLVVFTYDVLYDVCMFDVIDEWWIRVNRL